MPLYLVPAQKDSQEQAPKKLYPGFSIGFLIADQGRFDLNLPLPEKLKGESSPITQGNSPIALVIEEANGRLLIEDRSSFKALKIGLHSLNRVAILPGIKVKIFDQLFEVIENQEPQERPSSQEASEDHSSHSWEGQFYQHLKNLTPKEAGKIISLPKVLEKPIAVEVTRGPQAGEFFVLAYLPFEFGNLSLEGNLWESRAPSNAFTIEWHDPDFQFKTEHPKIVKINRSELSEKRLFDGDKIVIGPTELTVRLNL